MQSVNFVRRSTTVYPTMEILHLLMQVINLAQGAWTARHSSGPTAIPKAKSNLDREDALSEETNLLPLQSNNVVKRPSRGPQSLRCRGRLEGVVGRGPLQSCSTGTENATTTWSRFSRSGATNEAPAPCKVARVPCFAEYLGADRAAPG
ncbi:hypothetical protein V7S43_012884 [Phytophthora oleae]|uniref:Uncharacterized protein n=1 Tax=Phytophthora oleae TaxID=2107226 RepID=A0ABD3F985_9STRA